METAEVLATARGHVEEEILLRNEYLAAADRGRRKRNRRAPCLKMLFFHQEIRRHVES